MKTLYLERLPPKDTGIQGFLTFKGHTLCTVERPWIPVDEHLGGKPFESCIPDGVYDLRLHTRGNGDIVLALDNPLLNVYYNETDVPESGGRYLILMHVGNWVKDIVGCVAPGMSKMTHASMPMVVSSRTAMKHIMNYVGTNQAQIDIRWIQ